MARSGRAANQRSRQPGWRDSHCDTPRQKQKQRRRKRRSSRTPTFECNKRVRRRRLLLTTVEFAFLCFPDIHRLRQPIFSRQHTHTPITHTDTPPVAHHAQDRSHVPLEPRRRSQGPLIPASRPLALLPTKHQTRQTPQHQTRGT